MSIYSNERFLLFVGTYTKDLGFVHGAAKGISTFQLDVNNGILHFLTENIGIESPSFLAVHPSRKFLFSVNESSPSGNISAFIINSKSGELTLINQQSSQGAAPCFITMEKTGRFAFTTNYSSGNVLVYPINENGSLEPPSDNIYHNGSGPNHARQESPHAHSVWIDPNSHFALVCDLGIDKVVAYQLDLSNGTLRYHSDGIVHPGAGPRHLDFHPNGKLVYVINELDSTMSTITWDSDLGKLLEVQSISTLPDGINTPNSCADVHVHPSGKYLYGSNRGHDSIVIYAIDERTGRLSKLAHESTKGKSPRNFVIDPTGQYLLVANQDSGNISTFRINSKEGNLDFIGTTMTPTPVCLKFYI